MNPSAAALRELRWGVPVLVLLLLGEISSVWGNAQDPVWTQWLDLFWIIAIPLLAGFLVWRLSRSQTDYTRRFWTLIALFCGFYGITALLSQILGYGNTQNLLSLSNLTFLLGNAFMLVASLKLWPRLVGWAGVRQVLEVLIIIVGKALILWCLYYGSLFENYQQTAPTQLTVLFVFLTFGLLIESVVVLAPTEPRPFPRWLAGGLVLLNTTTSLYLAQVVQGSLNPPLWMSLCGSLGFVLVVLAAASPYLRVPSYHASIVRGLWYLPQIFFVISLGVFLVTAIGELLPEFALHLSVYLFAAVATLVFLHQFIVQLDNRRLNQDLLELNNTLEQRVEERSQELEQSRNYLLAAERLASLGQLTAGLAHEVNTPLAAAMTSFKQADGLAQEYRQSIGHPQVSQSDHREIASELGQKLGAGIASLERLGEIVRKMRNQTRQQSEGKVQVNLAGVLRDTLDLLQHPAMKAKVQLSLEAPLEVRLVCEPGRLSQIITNLVTNAIHACEEAREQQSGAGQGVVVRLREEAQCIRIEVQDDGMGIPEAVRGRIFEPLFTTKEAGRGTGLGLPIVRDIVVSNFGGNLDFQTEVGRGTTFSVILPKPPQAVGVGG